MLNDSVEINSFSSEVNEGLSLEDSPNKLPQDVLNRILPGWEVQLRGTGGEDFWARVLSKEPSGYVCQITQQLFQTGQHGLKQGDRLFVQPRNIFAVAEGNDRFINEGKGLSVQREEIRPLPNGQAQSFSSYSVYTDNL